MIISGQVKNSTVVTIGMTTQRPLINIMALTRIFLVLMVSETHPEAASVRVMTVHQAKGLEFDVVVLPELDFDLGGGRSSRRFTLVERKPEDGSIQRVFPYVREDLQPHFPEVAEAVRQTRAAGIRDALGVLYVALTRARHALHLEQEGEELSGRYYSPYGDYQVSGRLAPNGTVSFGVPVQHQHVGAHYSFNGSLAGQVMQGEVDLGEYWSGTWRAERAG